VRTNRRKLNQRAKISDAIKIAGPIGRRSSLLFRKMVDISGLRVTSPHDDCRGRGAGAPVCSPWHLNSDHAIDTMRQNALRRFPRTPWGSLAPATTVMLKPTDALPHPVKTMADLNQSDREERVELDLF
jgi:hypothetical protein